jgi:beta-xylosidase
VRWENDWPVIGDARPGETAGVPVHVWPKPEVGRAFPVEVPRTSDEFDGPSLGLQWQWNHNPIDANWSLTARPGYLRLIAAPAENLHQARNTLTQKLADPALQATAEMDAQGMRDGQQAGLSVFGASYGWIGLVQEDGRRRVRMVHNHANRRDAGLYVADGPEVAAPTVWLRARVRADETASFEWSPDGRQFAPLGEPMKLTFGWWKGQKLGLFSFTTDRRPDAPAGLADFNWFRYEA